MPHDVGHQYEGPRPLLSEQAEYGFLALGGTTSECPQVAEDELLNETAISVPNGCEWRSYAAITMTCWRTGRIAIGWLIVLEYRELSRRP
eukprot:5863124-Heterocapsa_arctica.AAC.1